MVEYSTHGSAVVRARACVCVCVCARARARVWVYVRVGVGLWVCACVYATHLPPVACRLFHLPRCIYLYLATSYVAAQKQMLYLYPRRPAVYIISELWIVYGVVLRSTCEITNIRLLKQN